MSGSVKSEHLTFFHVTRRSMENSIYTSLDLVKLKISHFAMLFEDLQKFLCTFLDQLLVFSVTPFKIDQNKK